MIDVDATHKVRISSEELAKMQKPTLEQAKVDAFDTMRQIEGLRAKLNQITAFIDAEEKALKSEETKADEAGDGM